MGLKTGCCGMAWSGVCSACELPPYRDSCPIGALAFRPVVIAGRLVHCSPFGSCCTVCFPELGGKVLR